MNRRQLFLAKRISLAAQQTGIAAIIGNVRIMAARVQAGLQKSVGKGSERAGTVDRNILTVQNLPA